MSDTELDGAVPNNSPQESTTGDGTSEDSDTLDGDDRDGEAPEERRESYVERGILEMFVVNHSSSEHSLEGEKPVENMLMTQERIHQAYQREEEDLLARISSEVFYFSCRPYRPSAVVAYMDSPWLQEQLKPITFDEMTLQTHHRGRSIRLTNVGYSRSHFGWMHCGVKDSTGALGKIVLHNMRANRPVETVLPHFVEFIVKEPYYTLHCDGKAVVRVDHLSDLIISSPYTAGMEGGLSHYPTPDVSPRRRHLLAADLYSKGKDLYMQGKYEKARPWLRDAAWIAAENDWPGSEVQYRISQDTRALTDFGDAKCDLVYLRATAAIGHRELNPPLYQFPKELRVGAIQSMSAHCALARGDLAMAARHYRQHAKIADLRDTINLFDKLDFPSRLREQQLGEYELEGLQGVEISSRKSFLSNVVVDNERKCLIAARGIRAGDRISAELVYEWAHERSSGSAPKTQRIEYEEGAVIPRRIFGAQAELVPAVLEKCRRFFISTRERTSLFDEVPRDPKSQEPYDAFHIQDVVYRHAIKWHTTLKDGNISHAAAIWPTSAYVRGSDDPNSRGEIKADMLLLTATREIRKGDIMTMREITVEGNSFEYKTEENCQEKNGKDLESFLSARTDESQRSIIDPGGRLFDTGPGKEMVRDLKWQEEMEKLVDALYKADENTRTLTTEKYLEKLEEHATAMEVVTDFYLRLIELEKEPDSVTKSQRILLCEEELREEIIKADKLRMELDKAVLLTS